ncbi:MAG: MMPL family transporter, partial [Bacilli bacterium]|nr:MMPL family transporter [Bacilli bacterium]
LYENRAFLPIDKDTVSLIESYYKSISFLESKDYTRAVLTIDAEIESDKALDLIEEIRTKTDEYYEEPLFIGNSINSRDLKSTFLSDNLIITFVTVVFIAIILMITFKSFGLTILLILTIEGSILVNFAIVTLLGYKVFFMSYIIVCAIQMGATIDYAIVIADRYLQLRKKHDKRESLIRTLHDRLLAIITSGLILLSAGFLVGTITTSSVISSIGLLLGLGTLISLLATMLFLPAILYTFDRFIDITTIKTKKRKKQ